MDKPSHENAAGNQSEVSASVSEGPLIRPRSVKIFLAVIVCILVAYFSVNVISHDPRSAAAMAEHFANAAFVKNDVASAHADLSSEMQSAYPAGELTADLSKMHPAGRPTEVAAIEYGPIPGQKAMNIYLKGSGGNEAFYYRLLMVGTSEQGYKVGGLWRGSGPYPPNGRKPL
jgi:hypothetical protein